MREGTPTAASLSLFCFKQAMLMATQDDSAAVAVAQLRVHMERQLVQAVRATV